MIAFMDLDSGQAELTPPGMISLTVIRRPLFGPPFSHYSWNDQDNFWYLNNI